MKERILVEKVLYSSPVWLPTFEVDDDIQFYM